MREWESPSYRAAMRDSGRGHLIGEGPSFVPLSRLTSESCARNEHGRCYGAARVRDPHEEDGHRDERCECECHEKKKDAPA